MMFLASGVMTLFKAFQVMMFSMEMLVMICFSVAKVMMSSMQAVVSTA